MKINNGLLLTETTNSKGAIAGRQWPLMLLVRWAYAPHIFPDSGRTPEVEGESVMLK